MKVTVKRFWVQGSGFRVQRFRVQRFWVQGFKGSGFWVLGSRFSAAAGLKSSQSNRKRNK